LAVTDEVDVTIISYGVHGKISSPAWLR